MRQGFPGWVVGHLVFGEQRLQRRGQQLGLPESGCDQQEYPIRRVHQGRDQGRTGRRGTDQVVRRQSGPGRGDGYILFYYSFSIIFNNFANFCK